MEGTFPNPTFEGGAQAYVPLDWPGLAHDPVSGSLQHANIALPAGEDFLRADFSRSGSDLLIETPPGGHFVVVDYFLGSNPPALETPLGAVLSASMVTHLAGPHAPAMVAQAAGLEFSGLGEPIGQMSESQGTVSVTHADGVKTALSIGDAIYQGDVLETGAESSAAVVFVDDTIFTLDGDGRMIMDEMVYDPDTQSGIFNAQVVQGVFSFVSGKVAKTAPDGMVITTPTNTIGIRGSTVLGRAAAEGAENKITLVTDVDGNVGEIVVSTPLGTIVLNVPGASTSVFSANLPPSAVVVLTPQQIQQDFGSTLTRLIQNVAKKAEQDTQQAKQQAEKADQEADQASEEAAQAEDEAAQAAAEAEAAAAEAEVALAEAEAAGDEEAIAKAEALAAEAAALEAEAADLEAQAELAANAAAEKATEAELAHDEVAKVEVFKDMAGGALEEQKGLFEQFGDEPLPDGEKGPPDGEKGPPDGEKGPPDGEKGPPDGEKGPDDGEPFPIDGMPFPIDGMPFPIDGPIDGLIDGPYDPFFDPFAMGPDIYDPLAFDPLFGGQDIYYDPFYDPNLVHAFGETIFAPFAGGGMSGTALNTNFYFHWGAIGSGAAYTISDGGGTNQIAFDNLNSVSVKVVFGAGGTTGSLTVFDDMTATNSYATVSFSAINQFLLSDVTVAGFSYADNFIEGAGGDVLVLGGMVAGDTGYVVAGTDAGEVLNITNANFVDLHGAIVFAKGGGDTINIDIITGDLTVIGGITTTDNVLADAVDLLPDSGLNTFDFTTTSYTAGTNGLFVSMNGDGGPSGDAFVTDRATQTAFHHDLWDVSVFTASAGNDLINVNSGYYNALNGGAGADTVTISTNAYFYTVDLGTENDALTIDSNLLSTATATGAINGGAGTDALTVQTFSGGAINLATTAITGFESMNFTGANSATNSVSVTGANVTTTMTGTSFGDTLVGGTAADTLIGSYGADTLTGGGGTDIFKYLNSGESGAGAGVRDTITDFATTADKINIAGIVGAGSFAFEALSSGSVASVQAALSGNILQFDTTNDGAADMEIDLGGAAVAVGDFVTV